MRRNKVVSVEAATQVVLDGDTITTGGFVGVGFPEELAIALERRYLATGSPRDLTLVYAAGQGDGKTRGLNHLAHTGMVKRVIGGHWGLVPALGELALDNKIEAYCFPQGVVAQLYRDIAAGRPGTLSTVGLHTFIDPRLEGGRMNEITTEDLVEVVEVGGRECLFFRSFGIQVGLLRGTTADEQGNVSMEREALPLDALAIAQAVKNSGGIVVVQVERVTASGTLRPRDVVIPGILVDAVVVSQPENHTQTFAESYNPTYTGEIRSRTDVTPTPLSIRKVIARRAAMALKPNSVVNLGIGMPEGIASVAAEERVLDVITLTVEAGAVGGLPASGLSFGAVADADAHIAQSAMFDFYDGGGLDQAFLGMAEVDAEGSVNVSRFRPKLAGPGGFVNISQNAKSVFFLATFTPRTQTVIENGRLRIVQDGTTRRFVERLQQVTFSGRYALERGQRVHYITERCVFRLTPAGLELTEVAPGVDIEDDVLAHMEFKPVVPDEVGLMDPRIFLDEPMGLARWAPMTMAERFTRHADGCVYVNFEGLRLATEADVEELEGFLDAEFRRIGHRVHVVVNYDNFDLESSAQDAFFAMVRRNAERYFLSSTRYSTNAFYRHLLGRQFARAQLDQLIYPSFAEARRAIAPRTDG